MTFLPWTLNFLSPVSISGVWVLIRCVPPCLVLCGAGGLIQGLVLATQAVCLQSHHFSLLGFFLFCFFLMLGIEPSTLCILTDTLLLTYIPSFMFGFHSFCCIFYLYQAVPKVQCVCLCLFLIFIFT